MIKALRSKKVAMLAALSAIAIGMFASTAMAYTDPQTGDLLYEVYDLLIDGLLAGPLGFVIAAVMFIGGVFLLVQGKGFLLPFVCMAGAVVIVKLKDIVLSFGFTLDGAQVLASKAMAMLPSAVQFLN